MLPGHDPDRGPGLNRSVYLDGGLTTTTVIMHTGAIPAFSDFG